MSTTKQIERWVWRPEAIARCFNREVLTLHVNVRGKFYLLGTIPCIRVHVCGFVVGIIVYEAAICYLVDDGTAVLRCFRPSNSRGINVKIGSLVAITGFPRQRDQGMILVIPPRYGKLQVCHHNAEARHRTAVKRLYAYYYTQEEQFILPTAVAPRGTQIRHPYTYSVSAFTPNLFTKFLYHALCHLQSPLAEPWVTVRSLRRIPTLAYVGYMVVRAEQYRNGRKQDGQQEKRVNSLFTSSLLDLQLVRCIIYSEDPTATLVNTDKCKIPGFDSRLSSFFEVDPDAQRRRPSERETRYLLAEPQILASCLEEVIRKLNGLQRKLQVRGLLAEGATTRAISKHLATELRYKHLRPQHIVETLAWLKKQSRVKCINNGTWQWGLVE